jgi:hypothetical protein
MAKVKKRPRTRSGVEITPELEDQLAAEAERGYDLSQARRRPVGRPSLGNGGSSPRMTFRVSSETFEAARQRARQEARSISDLAREAVELYLDT